MRKLLVVCLGVAVLWSVALGASALSETFALAERVGEGNERSFFVLSTSAGNYVIRHDGMGEFTSPAGLRRVFMLRVGAKARIDRMYFLEHQRDLFLMYEVHDASSQRAYLVRMEQTKRKARWITEIDGTDLGAPVIQGESVVINKIEISKANGQDKQD
ncbi:MAG TPA: hypothetical protein VFT48_00210 [Pyrinomonadaceae bacterium]|nr:hypothetical protein [Pyrinomonadaceae bacterium]